MKKILIIVAIAVSALSSCKKSEVTYQEEVVRSSSKKAGAETLATTFNVTPSTNLNSTFWTGVQNALQSGPVDVIFASGTYTRTVAVALNNIGHTTNRLNLKTAATGTLAIFTGNNINKLMTFNNCQNVYLLRFRFTGNINDFALSVSNSNNIHIAYSEFINLPIVIYGALGVDHSDNVHVKYNTFSKVGNSAQAHMVYGAYGTTRLKVVQNTFTDCAGSFVRFRGDLSTHGVVYENTFKSNGTYSGGANPVFVEVPVFNDVNPGDERFGTSFMIAKNSFTYSTSGNQSTRFAFVFHHSGYNPPSRTHLISVSDANLLATGSITQRRSIMTSRLGLNGNEIRYGNNTSVNVQNQVSYRCNSAYGAVGPWNGVVNISPAVSTNFLATTQAEAFAYYDNLY